MNGRTGRRPTEHFFLDENSQKTAHRILTALGHQVFDIWGTELAGEDDPDLFELAQSHQFSRPRCGIHPVPTDINFPQPDHLPLNQTNQSTTNP